MNADHILEKPWIKRCQIDRRSGKNPRRTIRRSARVKYIGIERRSLNDRRQEDERRDGWLRINKWGSISVFDK